WTTREIDLQQKCAWVSFYATMVAASINAGARGAEGYDQESLPQAIGKAESGWKLPLKGEPVLPGQAMGRVLGGCMTLVEATIGTPWELDTKDSILILEDRAMKPYQVDRVLMHLKQAGKWEGVKGIVLGEFPDSPAAAGAPTVKEV